MEPTTQSATSRNRISVQQWEQLRPDLAQQLGDSRLQFHHAVQFATAAGISYLAPRPDDSHTNLEWVPEFRALFSRRIPATKTFRIGVRPADLTLLVVPEPPMRIAALGLNGCTITDATSWIRERIVAQGADSSRYTLNRHYEIPTHPVAKGAAFDSRGADSFDELAKWFANAFAILRNLARSTPMSSDVRCWPHHFDVGMLIDATGNRSIGVGLELGDDHYDEPYFYVNMTPQPGVDRVAELRLDGEGSWHTNGWIGAVLPGSRLRGNASQLSQVGGFLDSAIAAAREIVRGD